MARQALAVRITKIKKSPSTIDSISHDNRNRCNSDKENLYSFQYVTDIPTTSSPFCSSNSINLAGSSGSYEEYSPMEVSEEYSVVPSSSHYPQVEEKTQFNQTPQPTYSTIPLSTKQPGRKICPLATLVGRKRSNSKIAAMLAEGSSSKTSKCGFFQPKPSANLENRRSGMSNSLGRPMQQRNRVETLTKRPGSIKLLEAIPERPKKRGRKRRDGY